MPSAAFTINGQRPPVDVNGDVVCRLQSTADVRSVEWSIIGRARTSHTPVTTVSDNGFVFSFDCSDLGEGQAYLIQCVVNGGKDASRISRSALTYRGSAFVPFPAGIRPLCYKETFEVDTECGQYDRLNELLGIWCGTLPQPNQIFGTDLKQWCRADRGVTQGVAGHVAEWRDFSGNDNDYVALESADQPTWHANGSGGPNARAHIEFISDDQLICPTLTLPNPSVTTVLISMVLELRVWAATKVIVANDGGTERSMTLVCNPTFARVRQRGDNAASVGPWNENNGFGGNDVWKRVNATFRGSTSDALKIGATTVTGNNSGTNTATGRRLGSAPVAGLNHGEFSIAEILYITGSGALNAGKLTQLEDYYTARYTSGIL